MADIIRTCGMIMRLGFASIPSTWFVIVLPAAAIVALIVAIRRL